VFLSNLQALKAKQSDSQQYSVTGTVTFTGASDSTHGDSSTFDISNPQMVFMLNR